ncbi:MAG: bifunctional oligoribonuclease/PAP phosphatase NrnA, partial [Muribaculaceae bacterium]|nr:bifunctional oligoribonuclease/PAP phosphatase NrnA [Muribaculaceae bacterium]
MMTDTGNFSYNSNDPEIYEIINRFLKLGIDKDKIYLDILNTYSENIIRLNAHLLCNRMTVDYDLHCAFLKLNKADQEAFGFKHGNTEGLVNKPLAIPSVHYSFYLREEPNYIRVSARSKEGYNVSELCDVLGGGGHGNAAGAEYKEGNIDDAERRIREYLSNHITN